MEQQQLQIVRLNNLRKLIEREGSVSVLAKRLRVSPIYLYQVLEARTPLRDVMTRHIELIMMLEPGALDGEGELDAALDVPMLSLTQRVNASIRAVATQNGEAVAISRTKITPQMRDAFIDAIVDNLEQMAQNRQISLLPQHKAVLLKLAFKRVLEEGDMPTAKSA